MAEIKSKLGDLNTNSYALLRKIDNLANKTFNCFGGIFNMDETKEKVDTIAVDIYDYMSASIISILINFILLISILEDQEFGVILFVNTLIASMILLTFISQKNEIKLISTNFLKNHFPLILISLIVQFFITYFFTIILIFFTILF